MTHPFKLALVLATMCWACSDGRVTGSAGSACKHDTDCYGTLRCIDGRCLDDRCETRSCPTGFGCVDGVCQEPACLDVTCPGGEECVAGRCYPKDCDTHLCPGVGEVCVEESCLPLGCLEVVCPTGQRCAAGKCYPIACETKVCPELGNVCLDEQCVQTSCVDVLCPPGQECANGRCYPGDCEPPCGPGQVCQSDTCVEVACAGVDCGSGQACAGGQCYQTECDGVICPAGQVCENDVCVQAECVNGQCCPAVPCAAANMCQQETCADAAYRCVWLEGAWRWDLSSRTCDDSDACTSDDSCQSDGTCAGIQKRCDDAPADYCLDQYRLRDYLPNGSCLLGECTYPYDDITCPVGCENDACKLCTPDWQDVGGCNCTPSECDDCQGDQLQSDGCGNQRNQPCQVPATGCDHACCSGACCGPGQVCNDQDACCTPSWVDVTACDCTPATCVSCNGHKQQVDGCGHTQSVDCQLPATACNGAPCCGGICCPAGQFCSASQTCVSLSWTWVGIDAGGFYMGSPAAETGRDYYDLLNETRHYVTLTRDFQMASTEVTQGDFEKIRGYNPANWASCGANCPIEHIYWDEAAAFCNALSVSAGLDPCFDCSGTGSSVSCDIAAAYPNPYTCPGYRFPSEAEWEYAARAGTQTPVYNGTISILSCSASTDATLNGIAWYWRNSNSSIAEAAEIRCYDTDWSELYNTVAVHPVASKTQNPWGLYDMAGNVWEWVLDCGYDYSGQTEEDPLGPLNCQSNRRIFRGCGQGNTGFFCRHAERTHYPCSDTQRCRDIGFRVVRTLAP